MKRLMLWIALTLLSFTLAPAFSQEILLGAGDVVKVSVYGNPDLTLETRVSEDGKLTFPLLGGVAVGGLSVAAAENKISTMLEAGGFLRKAQVNILITMLQSQQVSVLGQITRPGRYPLESKRGVLDMLAVAGGIAPDGGDTVTYIHRENGKVTKEVIDVIDMVRSGDMQRDFVLSGGDVIYVERSPRFYIYGEVQRPGTFRLERSMTVIQALSTGGGLTPRGTERGISIKRRDAKGVLQTISAKHDDLVQSDDVIYVKESLF